MRILYFLLACSCIFFSCDKISDPYAHLDDDINVNTDSTFNDTTYSDSTIIQSKRIVIEDFTGHLCPNCPKGTDIAKEIVNDYPEQVFVIALHNSSNFSKPDPDKGFPANFETDAGEKLRIKFKIGSFPNGLINRIDFSKGTAQSRAVGIDLWKNTIDGLILDANYMKQAFSMKVMSIYNSESRLVSIIPTIKCLEAQVGNYYVVIDVLENGIVSPQEDNRSTPPIIEDYTHNHLLRGSYPQNGDGKLVFTDPNQGDLYSDSEPIEFLINENWVAENCELILLLYSENNDEIVHAEKLALVSD